ncbi:MAG: nucleotidyltransferase family protein [Burkholderiaceae bacterium]|nr:nucleotidyltransferase family protein [Burkholderiaceae bacterium]
MKTPILTDPGLRELIGVLRDPAATMSLAPGQWNQVLYRARKHGLAARVASDLYRLGLFERAPAKARVHLQAAAIACRSAQTAVGYELDRMRRALELSGVEVPVIVLKGAAYKLADLPASRGRFIGDLDLMVAFDHVDTVEGALLAKGWESSKLNAYDERYYREWMHEIPPLQHPERDTPIDLHHTILPRTARAKPDTAALLAAAVPVSQGNLRVLSPPDMVLHGAVHLFHGESGKPLRDLLDQCDLIGHFSSVPGFWAALLERAQRHQLGRTLYYSLRYAQGLLGAPVPSEVQRAAERWRPPPALRPVMDRLLISYLLSTPGEAAARRSAITDALMLARSHWLKMPFGLLVRHLAVKARARYDKRQDELVGDDDALPR